MSTGTAPIFFDISRRSGIWSIASTIFGLKVSAAICVNSPTGPEPTTATTSPGLISPRSAQK